jgi:hypothetical protein
VPPVDRDGTFLYERLDPLAVADKTLSPQHREPSPLSCSAHVAVAGQFRLNRFDNPAPAKVPTDHAAVAHQVAEQALGALLALALKAVKDLAAEPTKGRAGSGDHPCTVGWANDFSPSAGRLGEPQLDPARVATFE